MKPKERLKIGITHGDINGIGYEVIIKTLLDNRINELCVPILYGSSKFAAYHRKAINIANFSLNQIKEADQANDKRSNIIECCNDNIRVELGKSTKVAGVAAFESLERACTDLKNGSIDILVTAPIQKENIQSESFKFPGHTEYLASKFETPEVLMLMVGEGLRVAVVTGHTPVNQITSGITIDNILNKLEILQKTLERDFGIRGPKIAVLGLNPHAGDNGLIGNEESEIIIPAINKAKEKNIIALGPYAADGFFGSRAYEKFDAVLAMYHDQGLIPFKTLNYMSGVNYTAGLPVIRTSPAHGTAFEIAGSGVASEDSFREAMFLGIDIYRHRELYTEITSNPLEIKLNLKEESSNH